MCKPVRAIEVRIWVKTLGAVALAPNLAEKETRRLDSKSSRITPPDYSNMNFDFGGPGPVKPAGTELSLVQVTTMDI